MLDLLNYVHIVVDILEYCYEMDLCFHVENNFGLLLVVVFPIIVFVDDKNVVRLQKKKQ